ncbi:MAG: M23 family metallopeptidase [Fidelibacterota bacterium]
MKSTRYTIHIIPDNVDGQKSFSISRFWIWILSLLFFVFMLSIGTGLWYYVPRITKFHEKDHQYEKMLSERTQVLELYRNLNRLGQMEEIIRTNLGVVDGGELGVNPFAEKEFTISYVENIPSQAPVDGFMTQRMMDNSHVWQKNHYGIDIAVSEGEPVLAAASGRIIFSGWTYNLGNLIIIYHGDGYFTHYGHHQLNLMQTHGIVKRGDVIALSGSTGISSGPHLHFEIWKNGRVIDPLEFFPEYKKKDLSVNKNG